MKTDNIDKQIFMVGTGGQGILILAKAISELFFRRGLKIISSETHGMAMRGGTVISHLKIGDYESPIIPVGSADMLIGLDEIEALSHLHYLKPDGVSVVNAKNKGRFDYSIDATGISLKSGSSSGANIIVLGLVIKIMNIDIEEAKLVLKDISPKNWLSANIEALGLGYYYEELRC
jgi:indolepyruvate ferredoxin oxidoreductase beta subunit